MKRASGSQSQNYVDWSECLGISLFLCVYTIMLQNTTCVYIYISLSKTQVHSGDSFRYIAVFHDMGILLCNKIMFQIWVKSCFLICVYKNVCFQTEAIYADVSIKINRVRVTIQFSFIIVLYR